MNYQFTNTTKNILTKLLLLSTAIILLSACNETKTDNHLEAAAPLVTSKTESTPAQNKNINTEPSQDEIEYEQFEALYLETEITQSIWPRIRAGFQLPADMDHRSLQKELQWFAKHPDYMQRVMQRADPFLYYILEQIEKRNLPSELILLPIVESAYQPFAYSHGRAAGLWQFIPSTGRMYGLKQNWWYDGRRDIFEATQAALNYLERLNKQFDGDWMLALAAYNSGSGT